MLIDVAKVWVQIPMREMQKYKTMLGDTMQFNTIELTVQTYLLSI